MYAFAPEPSFSCPSINFVLPPSEKKIYNWIVWQISAICWVWVWRVFAFRMWGWSPFNAGIFMLSSDAVKWQFMAGQLDIAPTCQQPSRQSVCYVFTSFFSRLFFVVLSLIRCCWHLKQNELARRAKKDGPCVKHQGFAQYSQTEETTERQQAKWRGIDGWQNTQKTTMTTSTYLMNVPNYFGTR